MQFLILISFILEGETAMEPTITIGWYLLGCPSLITNYPLLYYTNRILHVVLTLDLLLIYLKIKLACNHLYWKYHKRILIWSSMLYNKHTFNCCKGFPGQWGHIGFERASPLEVPTNHHSHQVWFQTMHICLININKILMIYKKI